MDITGNTILITAAARGSAAVWRRPSSLLVLASSSLEMFAENHVLIETSM